MSNSVKAGEPITIQGAHGVLPNPSSFGYAWKPLQKLISEQQRLFGESRELGFKIQELRDQVAFLERSEVDALAAALRSGGPEPDGADIEQTREELKKLEKRSQALAQALQKLDKEIVATAQKYAEEWQEEVYASAKERVKDVEAAIARLRDVQGDLYQLKALAEWLENPKKSFGFREGPGLLDTFSHRGIRPAEFYDAVIQNAREVAATEEEQQWARPGVVTTTGIGWDS